MARRIPYLQRKVVVATPDVRCSTALTDLGPLHQHERYWETKAMRSILLAVALLLAGLHVPASAQSVPMLFIPACLTTYVVAGTGAEIICPASVTQSTGDRCACIYNKTILGGRVLWVFRDTKFNATRLVRFTPR